MGGSGGDGGVSGEILLTSSDSSTPTVNTTNGDGLVLESQGGDGGTGGEG